MVVMVDFKDKNHLSQILPGNKLVIQLTIQCEVMIQLVQLLTKPCLSVTPSLC